MPGSNHQLRTSTRRETPAAAHRSAELQNAKSREGARHGRQAAARRQTRRRSTNWESRRALFVNGLTPSCILKVHRVTKKREKRTSHVAPEISQLRGNVPSPRFASAFAPQLAGRGGRLRGSSSLPLRSRTRRGFTFTEILFAVLILGIGFILIAAIFPVALKQTQATSEETTAATIAKGGVSYLAKYNTQSYWYTPAGAVASATMPDGYVHPIGPTAVAGEPVMTNTTLWPLISGNLILPSDPRYAWIPLYRQVNGQPYVQVILIGVQARNRSFYDSNDLAARTNGIPSLEARPLTVTTVTNTSTQQQFTFADVAGQSNLGCLADGAFVVIANDSNAGNTNGWIYRLGTNSSGNIWNLAPGNDMANATYAPGANSTVMVIGAGYSDSNAATTTYSGPVQDVAAYTTFLALH